MADHTYYVTTPIYYVNDKPHIGHAYTTVLADVLSRYHRAASDDTFFLTGTDEHGQKVQKAAQEHSITPIEQCDSTVVRFQELWKKLEISNDDFIRTTEERHKKIVRSILQDLYDRDLIYKAEYSGRYCVPCERFFTEKDLLEGGLCPECRRETNEIVESNYFFRMSRYQDWLITYIKEHPDFIQPAFRANETLGFLKRPLEDLCISRPKSRLSWGIELPFDPDYVCYVWFDALINYISAIGYGSDEVKFRKYWSAAHHLIGKDILTTHTVYWPTMLKAMGLEMPKSIFAHGWWLSGNDKMSKSRGNVVNPMDMADRYGVDAFRYFLMAEMSLGNDAAFSEEAFIDRYNRDLANDLGNMLSRVVKLTFKYFDGKVPAPGELQREDEVLKGLALGVAPVMAAAVSEMALDRGLDHVMNVVRGANRYMEKTAPWNLAKNGEMERLGTVLYTAAETLRVVSGLLAPVMPGKMLELRKCIGMPEEEAALTDGKRLQTWGLLKPASQMQDITALFPRILPQQQASASASSEGAAAGSGTGSQSREKLAEKKVSPSADKQKQSPEKKELSPEGVMMVTVEEFFRTSLRTAKVLEAEKVEGADKLLKLKIRIGAETRTLVAGVAKFYSPEEMLGKVIVVVANLKPAKIRGIESEGMLLAAKDGDSLRLITVDGGDFPDGASVG